MSERQSTALREAIDDYVNGSPIGAKSWKDVTDVGLADAATSFMRWNDELRANAGDEKADSFARSIGLIHAARYVAALSKAAQAEGSVQPELLEPARRIVIALFDAGNGFSSPLFRHETYPQRLANAYWGGRKAPSRLAMEGRAVGCAYFLVEELFMSVREACEFVAKSFAPFGHPGRKGARLSGATIRGWFDALVAKTGSKAKSDPRAGWADVNAISDLYRQNEAVETATLLTRRYAQNRDITEWLNKAIFTLAAECSTTASSSAMNLSDLGGM